MFSFAKCCLFLIFLVSCQSVKMLTPKEIYKPDFLEKVDKANEKISSGKKQEAKEILNNLNDTELVNQEKAKKYNLLGVLYFNESQYDLSLENFHKARANSTIDVHLTSLINLNIASTYFKLNDFVETSKYLKDVKVEYLSADDQRKFYQLLYVASRKNNINSSLVIAIIGLSNNIKNLDEMEASTYKAELVSAYNQLTTSERIAILEKYEEEKLIVTGFLAKEEVVSRFYSGDKSGAEDVMDWIEKYYRSNVEMTDFIQEFKSRMKNLAELDMLSIGVVLPMTGNMSQYAQKAMAGIDVALSHLQKSNLLINLHIKDSQNNSLIAKEHIEHLVRNKHVSIIIGGLFPNTAKEEYLEAKKYGVLYISLSPVYIEREQKNHLLVEIPGSIQSQVETLLSDDFLNNNGRRVAIFYPESERGHVYVDEFWKHQDKIQITEVQGFDESIRDYRGPVKKILGLHYENERAEELRILKSIYANEKKGNIRRTQTLTPIIDFDWVFSPSYPQEAIQIIPSFGYFDANKVTFVGGPSWLSKSMLNEKKNLSNNLFLVGDDPEEISNDFLEEFKKKYSYIPRLIETLGYESLMVTKNILVGKNISERDELERAVKKTNKLIGITSNWFLKDGLWIKDMDIMSITRSRIYKTNK